MQRTYVKLTESGDVEQSTAIRETNLPSIERFLAKGFLPLESEESTIEESSLGEFESLEWRYTQEEGRVVRRKERVVDSPSKIESVIRGLKEELANGDYRVVKAAESLLMGDACGDEMESIHQEREETRARIRELEGLLLTSQE